MSIFLEFFRSFLLWSKKHSFLSRISKNVSLCLFFAQKKTYEIRSIFWQKPWTNPLAKCRYSLTLLELHFSGLKSILFYQEYKKMFLSCFLCSKKTLEKRSIFCRKPGTNPFAKCRFFSTLWELYFSGPESFIFYPEYQKMFLSGFFFAQKKHMRKRSIFWQKPWTNPFAKCRFFWLC